MLIVGIKPGHDGALAAIRDGELLLSLEAEKDSFKRFASVSPATLLEFAQHLDALPDVVALGGWDAPTLLRHRPFGAGYLGTDDGAHWPSQFFGRPVQYFTSTHERSHIMSAIGMAPRLPGGPQAVLVWEGIIGGFYLIDERFGVIKKIPVLEFPGIRYAFLYDLADPKVHHHRYIPRSDNAGKLMALAAYGKASDADAAIRATVDRILAITEWGPRAKPGLADTPVFNAGLRSSELATAAALLTERIFELYAQAATSLLPAGLPLRISGGCGLNCEWNRQWRELGHFSSVFVPPCTNDSGSAIGTALDAQAAFTADPYLSWDVYRGIPMSRDAEPDPARWQRRALDNDALAQALSAGRIVAWVQGRSEIGPRALGNRSLLAEPFHAATRDRLNRIKQREGYRPIAPCCRLEDVGRIFDDPAPDPHMLYFKRVLEPTLAAVTHVDGTARAQTVSEAENPQLHALLTAFAARAGIGVLCNTSLNFKGYGFINRVSDLMLYCEERGITDAVIGDEWYERRPAPDAARLGDREAAAPGPGSASMAYTRLEDAGLDDGDELDEAAPGDVGLDQAAWTSLEGSNDF
jgi:hydroxymethyl cephem carbamoyltransferase